MAAGQCVWGDWLKVNHSTHVQRNEETGFWCVFLMEVYGTWICQGLDTLTSLLRIHSLLFFFGIYIEMINNNKNIEYHQNWNLKCKNRKRTPACGSCGSAANVSFNSAPLVSPNATCLLEEPLCSILGIRWTWSQTLTPIERLLFLTLKLSVLAAWYQLLAV